MKKLTHTTEGIEGSGKDWAPILSPTYPKVNPPRPCDEPCCTSGPRRPNHMLVTSP